MKQKINIFWFRRDLRLDDNVGLYHALNSNHIVLPIFIFDKDILESLPKDDARLTFIHEALSIINDTLQENFGRSITTFHNKPLKVFKKLVTKLHNSHSIYQPRLRTLCN